MATSHKATSSAVRPATYDGTVRRRPLGGLHAIADDLDRALNAAERAAALDIGVLNAVRRIASSRPGR